MSDKPTEILGKDAPEHWWDELKLLREKVAALEAEKKALRGQADALARELQRALVNLDNAEGMLTGGAPGKYESAYRALTEAGYGEQDKHG